MHQNLRCPKCGKLFSCDKTTARNVGPVLRIICPFCRKTSDRNMSAFIESQVDENLRVLEKAKLMIALAQRVNEIIEPEEEKQKKKKKK